MATTQQSALIHDALVYLTDEPDEGDRVERCDVRVDAGRITAVGKNLPHENLDCVIEGRGLVAMPGLVQAHVHLCQTLFRAQAEQMDLLTWLRARIWPFEGALEPEDLRASARLGIAELLLSGTTCVLDMGSVRHSDVLFETAAQMGIRYTGGKTIMDQGQGYPAGLRESTEQTIAESVRLADTWHGAEADRLRYAFSPRFVLSSSEGAIRACVQEARSRGCLLHSHASENSEEVELFRRRVRMGHVEYLHRLGFAGPDALLAHGVWLSAEERRLVQETGTHIVHCPAANLKLGSGIARVGELLEAGIDVVLGSDGAACSNSLDGFQQLRLAALLHKVRSGPQALSASTVLRMATRLGALALGLPDVGRISVGSRADIVLLDLRQPHLFPETGELADRIVYGCIGSDVHTVMVDGQILVRNRRLVRAELADILQEAQAASERLRARVG